MPGPGGGGRSGGGGRGFGGGGFGGGGFLGHGGGMHHRPRPHRPMGGWWFGPRYYGGGCLHGVLGSVFAVVIMAVVLVGFIAGAVTEIADGGSVRYDESKLQQYADTQYAQAFSDTAYEDNVLIVFLAGEDRYDYAYIAWVGDHLAPEIRDMLGDNNTDLGQAMESYISDTDYTYSLDTDLARVVKGIGQRIKALNLESNYDCQESRVDTNSRLINRSGLPMTEETVNQALSQFTEQTGIPCVIVVEEAEAVFGRGVSGFSIVTVAVIAIVLLIIVINLIRNYRRKNGYDDGERHRNDRHSDPF